jgi:hypothetical protein
MRSQPAANDSGTTPRAALAALVLSGIISRRPLRSSHGSVSLLPRPEPTLNVARGAKSSVLRRLHGHRGSFPEGAVEHEAFAGRSGNLVEQPTWAHVLLEIGVRGVE